MAEKLAMHVVDIAENDDFQENHDNVSCKISFILYLYWLGMLCYHFINVYFLLMLVRDNLIIKGHNILIISQTLIIYDIHFGIGII